MKLRIHAAAGATGNRLPHAAAKATEATAPEATEATAPEATEAATAAARPIAGARRRTATGQRARPRWRRSLRVGGRAKADNSCLESKLERGPGGDPLRPVLGVPACPGRGPRS
jgi:hypothetical protein